jgi:hypothetical protein
MPLLPAKETIQRFSPAVLQPHFHNIPFQRRHLVPQPTYHFIFTQLNEYGSNLPQQEHSISQELPLDYGECFGHHTKP